MPTRSSVAYASSMTSRRDPAAKQRVDLKGAREAALDALRLRQGGDVVAVKQDAAAARRQCASDQIDEGGLAGAVRSDQRVPCALLEAEVDITGHGERAEAAAQALCLERRAHRRLQRRCAARQAEVSTPLRAKTTTISSAPIQKSQ
jgi:hypothetical protein